MLMLFVLSCKTWNVVKPGAWLARFPPGAQNPPVLSVRLQVSHSQQAVIHSQGRVQAG